MFSKWQPFNAVALLDLVARADEVVVQADEVVVQADEVVARAMEHRKGKARDSPTQPIAQFQVRKEQRRLPQIHQLSHQSQIDLRSWTTQVRRLSRRQPHLQRQIRQQLQKEPKDDAEVLARPALLARQAVPVVLAPKAAAPVEEAYLVVEAVPDLVVEAARDLRPTVPTERFSLSMVKNCLLKR